LLAGAEACASCGRDEANPFTPPAAPIERVPAAEGDPRLYGAIMAVIAVSVIVSFVVPGLGIPLGIVLVPAAVRAAALLKRQQSAGSPPVRQIGFFHALLASAGVTFLVWLASAVACAFICTPVGIAAAGLKAGGDAAMVLAFGSGGLTGLAVFYLLMKQNWPGAAKDDNATA
jgi:hypothetical protein